MISRLSLLVTGIGVVAVGAIFASCGGDSGGSGSATIDASNADKLAHQAVLSEQDLPGSGWTVTKTDQFDDTSSTVDTAACKDINSKQASAKAKSDADRAGRAEQELSHDSSSSPIPTAVDTEVNIFNGTSTPSDVLKMYQDALKSSNFGTCLKDSINSSAGSDAQVTTTAATPLTSAPSGGVAIAYDFKFSIQGQSFSLHYETYTWRYANAGVTVTVNGSKDDVTADLVKQAVSKTQSKVQALAK